MHPKFNIRRATGASPAPATSLTDLLEQAASKARAARDIADGIENVDAVTMDDIIDLSNLCSAALRLINEAKQQATTDPQPPTPALAVVTNQTPLAA